MISPNIGVYTIGLKDLSFSEAIKWAELNNIPSLQIRGGERGYDLLNASELQIEEWSRQAKECGIRIQAVTTDIELREMVCCSASKLEEIRRFTHICKSLGSDTLRILAKEPFVEENAEISSIKPYEDIRFAVELHSKLWFAPQGLCKFTEIMRANKNIELLLDIGQLVSYLPYGKNTNEIFDIAVEAARLIHLSPAQIAADKAAAGYLADRFINSKQDYELCLEIFGENAISGSVLKEYETLCRDMAKWIGDMRGY